MAGIMFSPGCCCGPSACGPLVITVRDCTTSALLSGATVTVYEHPGMIVVGSGTTGAPGTVSVDLPASGTYRVKVEKSGQVTQESYNSWSCPPTATTVYLGRVINVTVIQCASGVGFVGETVTATLSGVTYSAVTNSSGVASISVGANGTYDIACTPSSPRWQPYTGTQAAATCGTFAKNAVLTLASGYQCLYWGTTINGVSQGCQVPLPTTLYATDPIYGAVTLVFSAVGGGRWTGTKTVSYAGAGGCIPVTATLTYTLHRTPFTGSGTNRIFGVSARLSTARPGCVAADGEAATGSGTDDATLASLACPGAFSLVTTGLTTFYGHSGTGGGAFTISE